MNAFSFDIGSEISAFSQRWIVKRILGPKEVLADHCETGQPKVLAIAQIGPPIEPEKEPVKVLDLEKVDSAAWNRQSPEPQVGRDLSLLAADLVSMQEAVMHDTLLGRRVVSGR